MSTDDARQVTGTPLLAHRAGGASARPKNTDRPSSAAPGSVDRLLDQLDMEAAVGCGWWETDTAAVVTGLVSAGAAAVVFTVIAHLLREGEDPDVIVGDTTAGAAFGVKAGRQPSTA